MLSVKEQIKICQRCFFCHSIVLCSTCNKCQECCLKSACRGQTSELLANLAGSGCRSESNSNTKTRLHPSLSDPAKAHKISHSRKLLWQSPQEKLPVGGITSAYGQKCSRASPQPNIFGVFQPTISGPQTQQQMETYLRSEQIKPLSQGGEIQNGDTGHHQDVPPIRGGGHLDRFQGFLLSYPNTGTIQKISQVPCRRSDIPVQSSALWCVTTAPLEFTVVAKEVKLMASYTQGYKNPPVPRRLVGEGQIPPGLSSVYTRTSADLSKLRVASKYGEIRTGTQTDFQLRRLPVRPSGRSSPTHSGLVAKSSGQNTSPLIPTFMSGEGVHVLDRVINSHRKTSSPRSPSHETNSVALKKQLESTGVTRKEDSSTQVIAPTLAVVARRRERPHRPTTTPNAACSANIYRRIKRRLGRSLKRAHCKRNLVIARKQTAYKLPRTQGSASSLKRVPKSLFGQNSTGSNRQHYSSVIHKQGRRLESGTLCALLWRILTWCTKNQVTLKARHIPGRLNVVADKLSRLGHTIQTEWSLLPAVFKTLCDRWDQPQIDLFATRFNNKVPQFVSPVPDTTATAVDALSLSWEELDAYAFPPTAILGKVVDKLQDTLCMRIIIIALGWPNMPWFWDLVAISSQIPLSLPLLPNLLTQPFNQIPHTNLSNLNLHAWLLEPQQSRSKGSLRTWQQELRLLRGDQPDQSMRQSGPYLQSGASLIRWTSGHPL